MKTTILITVLAILILSIPSCKPAEVNVKDIDSQKLAMANMKVMRKMNKARERLVSKIIE
jgi:S-adenosylmethionine:diacylglycerol 3-amino-3-carboxypropyl transferase